MSEVKKWESAIVCKGRVVVLEQTTSTQDAAIEHELKSGDVCAAFIQTAGRGRRGNEWDSSGGVAVTVVLSKATPHLSISVAALLAEQLDLLIEQPVGIKWPNDLLVNGRKLAGILIEHRVGICLVGVGVNVEKINQPNSISLRELGSGVDRAFVANLVVSTVFAGSELVHKDAISLWHSRDVLVGTNQSFTSNNQCVTGTVLSIDPLHNLLLKTEAGNITLHASTTTIN